MRYTVWLISDLRVQLKLTKWRHINCGYFIHSSIHQTYILAVHASIHEQILLSLLPSWLSMHTVCVLPRGDESKSVFISTKEG
jgi:hypothetical protein